MYRLYRNMSVIEMLEPDPNKSNPCDITIGSIADVVAMVERNCPEKPNKNWRYVQDMYRWRV